MFWLFRFLSVATAGNAQKSIATRNVRHTEEALRPERPLVVDESTAVAELARLLERIGKPNSTKRDDSDP